MKVCSVKPTILFKLFLINIFIVTLPVECDRIVFPDVFEEEISDSNKQIKPSKKEDDDNFTMPLEFARELSGIENVNQLIEKFGVLDEMKSSNGPRPRMAAYGGSLGFSDGEGLMSPFTADYSYLEEPITAVRSTSTVERAASLKVPKQAGCTPVLELVRLNTTENKRMFSVPSCTRVERCGGCCQHELLSCQAIESEIINYQVYLFEYNVHGPPKRKGVVTYPIEKHTKCKCDCIVKKSDCTALQEYREKECSCVCTNKDEESKCKEEIERPENPLNKFWDPGSCMCKCRDVMECSSGSFFSEVSCECEPITAFPVRGETKPHNFDYNVYKLLTSYHERQKHLRVD